ncbi:MAG TPA: glycosyltransferase [Stellaceae bacterium]|nr:glycosyltransferase [Stellaceae bacterium]
MVVSFPGNLIDAQQAARAFHERSALAAFVTGLVLNQGTIKWFGAPLPKRLRERLTKELARRAVTLVPPDVVVSHPWLDVLRTSLSRVTTNPIYADLAWDLMSHRFDRHVAQRHLDGIHAVHAFEYTARSTFEQARRRGIATILGMPSTDSKEFDEIKKREELRFPELRTEHHRYFASRFTPRYERRRAEIDLADVIVANSEVTKRSHVRNGTDPGKIVVVPLGAPPPITAITKAPPNVHEPLSVIWAGTLSVRKGAHYFINAWRMLRGRIHASAVVYGSVDLPERILRPIPEGLEIIGSIPQQDLFGAFEKADVLVFPTLADGFGLVITEAFSRGLPAITTEEAGGSALVEHGRNGLIVPAADSDALVEALRWCLDNRDALYQMRFGALETAKRWQWIDYRRMMVEKVSQGLSKSGCTVDFGPEIGSEVS